MATTWTSRRDTPMNERLLQQYIDDRLDADEAEGDAKVWERTMKTSGGKPRKWNNPRQTTLRMCGPATMYCPHKPACPPTSQEARTSRRIRRYQRW